MKQTTEETDEDIIFISVCLIYKQEANEVENGDDAIDEKRAKTELDKWIEFEESNREHECCGCDNISSSSSSSTNDGKK